MSSQDELPTFKVKVNLVLVRVVVRDAQGRAVGSMGKDDFRLLDNGKLQLIAKFAVERPGAEAEIAAKTSEAPPIENPHNPNPLASSFPEHYIAYLFDDIHFQPSELVRARDAADHNLNTLLPSDRAGIVSTSGQTVIDFTDDRMKIRDGLMTLRPHPIAGRASECPQISYYIADQIINKRDPRALQLAEEEFLECTPILLESGKQQAANSLATEIAMQTARRELELGEQETRITLATLKSVLQRTAAVPGQKTVLLVSPGFFITDEVLPILGDLIDQATRSNIIVSALDSRGLYAIVPEGDASQAGNFGPLQSTLKIQYEAANQLAQADVMESLADGTGGKYFHNSNDLEGGLKRLTVPPEYYYILGFSPQNLKNDGRFHKLKVELQSAGKFSVQARKGYYAPKRDADPEEQAKSEIEGALFSQEEQNDLPVQLHTQFFKPSEDRAKLSVLVRIDVKHLHFQKLEGRNCNNLTIVSGLFDRNGNYVTASEKILQMRLKDGTLANKLNSGVTMKSSFDVKPGSYLVRLVVRDDEGLISSGNGAVEIP